MLRQREFAFPSETCLGEHALATLLRKGTSVTMSYRSESLVPSRSVEQSGQDEIEVLDFASSARTPESRVKLFLNTRGSRENAIANVIALVGPGGVGKTTVLRGIERDRDVRNKYRHGLTFIELGQHITFAAFVMKLIRFVEPSTNLEWATKFTSLALDEKTQDQAVGDLANQLANAVNPMLLILDDVWSVDSKVYRFIQSLATSVNNSESSFKLVMSTRFQDIADTPVTGVTVEMMPHTYDSQQSKRILCRYAGVDESTIDKLSPENLTAATAVLHKCAGLPLTLAIAGRAIRLLRSTETPQDIIWVKYWEGMAKTRSAIVTCSPASRCGLFDTIRTSLTCLKSTWPNHVSLSPDQVVSSFCVFREQSEIRLDVVTSMWGIDPEQAKVVITMLCDSNLLLSGVSITEEGDSTYRIHNLIHEFGSAVAERKGTVSFWHRKLMSSYASRLPIRAMNRADGGPRGWWNDEFMKNSYMKDNVIHHLTLGGEMSEALRLLVDYRWIQKLNSDKRNVPFHQLLADAKCVYSFLRGKEKGVEVVSGDGSVRGILSDLAYFIETLELIMPQCATSRDECAFQLHGRLCIPSGETSLFDICLQGIEKFACHTWCRPMEGMLARPEQSLKRVFHTTRLVESMACHPAKDELVIGCEKLLQLRSFHVAAVDVLDSSSGRHKTMSDPNADVAWLLVKPGGIQKQKQNSIIALVVHSEEIAALSVQGIVTVWRGQKKIREFNPFVSPCKATCMTLVGKNTIACGSSLGAIRFFHAATWELQRTVGSENLSDLEPLREEMLLMRSAVPHTSAFNAQLSATNVFPSSRNSLHLLCASQDGRVVLSVSAFRRVLKWDPHTGLSRPWEVPYQAGIHCMAVNMNGTLAALGFSDGRVQICDTMSGNPKKTVAGHRGIVSCVLFSRDGKILYSGGTDKSVQYWDVKRGTRMGRPLRQHDAKITALSLSRDGTELFSASGKRICVSRAHPHRFGSTETGMESGFESKVQAFCFSRDKKTVVTVESDMIRFRDLRDPITRYEAMRQLSSSGANDFPSLPIAIEDKVDVVEHACLSHDGKSIAYSILRRNLLDDDQSRTNIYVARRSDRYSWGRSQRAPELSPLQFPKFADNASVEKLEFMPDDSLEVVFCPQLGQLSKSFLLIWSAADDMFRWEAKTADELDIEDWVSPSKMTLKLGKVVHFGSRVIGTLDVEAMPHRYIRGAVAENAVVFDENMNRLWVLNKDSRLQYVDLVNEAPRNEIFPPVPLPELKITDDPIPELEAQAKASHDVFVTFASPDKTSIAAPLSELLMSKGITCFIENDLLESTDEFPRDMVKAMEEAPICVVIASPEYPARGWTSRQLQSLMERRQIAKANGKQGPDIVPVFYRLESSKCRNLNLISDVYIANASLRQKYEELVSSGATEIWEMRKNMEGLGKMSGIENEEGAMNGIGLDMTERRRKLIARVANEVEEAHRRVCMLRENEIPDVVGGTADGNAGRMGE